MIINNLLETKNVTGISTNIPLENVKIGLISTLENLIQSTFVNDKTKNVDDYIPSLEKHCFRYRKINGDGNCFYRAVIFARLEAAILERNVEMLKFYVTEIFDLFNQSTLFAFSQQTESFVLRIDFTTTIFVLIKIIDILENYDDTEKQREIALLTAYSLFVNAYINLESFDLV